MSEKISVLMPTYNRASFIERSVLSILNQTYQNFDLWIYDDGSTDDTPQIIRNLIRHDNRIKYVTCFKNKGVASARNMLLRLCETRIACWMDSDDMAVPTRLESQIKAMQFPSMVFTWWENLNNKKIGKTLGFATLMFPVNPPVQFNQDMQFGGEDLDWIERMRKKYSKEICVEKVLYSIDFHGNRIGSWKRKLCKDWGGIYTPKDLEGLTYSEAIEKFKKETNG